MSAPNKAQREQCWSAKDSYWGCLEQNENDQSKCQELKEKFENSCSRTWVNYFNRRRDYLKYKEKIEKQGYEPVNEKQ